MTAPIGLGIFIWELPLCENGNISNIIAKTKRCNISWLAIHMDPITTDLVKTLHASGLYIAAWKYTIPGDDFITHADLCRRSGCDAILPDCEIEWETVNGGSKASDFAKALRDKVGTDCFLGNCGAWQWPDKHPLYPDHTFGKYWDAGMPERYWTMFPPSVSAKEALDESDKQWADPINRGAYKTLIPIGSAFDGSAQGGQSLTITDLEMFLNRQSTCALWSWQHISPDIWTYLE